VAHHIFFFLEIWLQPSSGSFLSYYCKKCYFWCNGKGQRCPLTKCGFEIYPIPYVWKKKLIFVEGFYKIWQPFIDFLQSVCINIYFPLFYLYKLLLYFLLQNYILYFRSVCFCFYFLFWIICRATIRKNIWASRCWLKIRYAQWKLYKLKEK